MLVPRLILPIVLIARALGATSAATVQFDPNSLASPEREVFIELRSRIASFDPALVIEECGTIGAAIEEMQLSPQVREEARGLLRSRLEDIARDDLFGLSKELLRSENLHAQSYGLLMVRGRPPDPEFLMRVEELVRSANPRVRGLALWHLQCAGRDVRDRIRNAIEGEPDAGVAAALAAQWLGGACGPPLGRDEMLTIWRSSKGLLRRTAAMWLAGTYSEPEIAGELAATILDPSLSLEERRSAAVCATGTEDPRLTEALLFLLSSEPGVAGDVAYALKARKDARITPALLAARDASEDPDVRREISSYLDERGVTCEEWQVSPFRSVELCGPERAAFAGLMAAIASQAPTVEAIEERVREIENAPLGESAREEGLYSLEWRCEEFVAEDPMLVYRLLASSLPGVQTIGLGLSVQTDDPDPTLLAHIAALSHSPNRDVLQRALMVMQLKGIDVTARITRSADLEMDEERAMDLARMALIEPGDPGTMPEESLRAIWRDSKGAVRRQAMLDLAEIYTAQDTAVELIAVMLDRHLPDDIRTAAIRAAGGIDDSRVTDALLELLRPENWFFGAHGAHGSLDPSAAVVAGALGERRDARIAGALRKACADAAQWNDPSIGQNIEHQLDQALSAQ
jgi:HEAT repeat protein